MMMIIIIIVRGYYDEYSYKLYELVLTVTLICIKVTFGNLKVGIIIESRNMIFFALLRDLELNYLQDKIFKQVFLDSDRPTWIVQHKYMDYMSYIVL